VATLFYPTIMKSSFTWAIAAALLVCMNALGRLNLIGINMIIPGIRSLAERPGFSKHPHSNP
jgi:hypothetical protein